MAYLTPPENFRLRNARWRLSVPMQVNRSGWTGTSKRIGLPGAQLWRVEGTVVPILTERNFLPWRRFLIGLQGQANTFIVRATETQQTSAANPTVRSGANAGTSVPLQGLPASTTVLLGGQCMVVDLPSGHARLVVLQADLVSNSSGQATAIFYPELGEVPTAGAVVTIQHGFSLMTLTSEPPGWDVDVGQVYSFPFSCEEAR